jgi:hypothetical protein
MMTKEIKGLIVLATLVSLLLTSGCFQQSVDYSIVVEYKPTGEIPQMVSPSQSKSIAIAKFEDARPDQTGIAGAKNPVGNIAIRYNSSRPLAIVVQEAFAKYFEAAGFKVVKTDFWDLDPNSIQDIATDLLLGGQIKAFWAENRPDPGQYALGGTGFASVKLKVVIIANDKTIIWSGELEGGTTTHNYWNTPSLKEMIDKALARAIESTFQDEGVRSAIANAIQ